MLSPRGWKVIHWLGYGCTLIVIVEVLALSGLALRGWVQYHQNLAELKNQTRTHDGMLVAHGQYDSASYAIPLFKLLPSPATFGGGFRFAALPGLGWHWYAVSLLDDGNEIEGSIVTVEPRRPNGGFSNPSTTRFVVSRSAYDEIMEKLGALTDGYAGDTRGLCLDGTEIAFERIRKDRTTSGSGNVCIKHYERVSDAVLALVRQTAGLPYPPRDGWFSSPSATQKER